MKKLILALCYLGVSLWVLAQPGPAPENVILTARATRTIQYGGPTRAEGRSYNFTPVFFIYPDGKLDKAGAEALLRELDIQSLLDSEYGTALVINPVGDKYVADADFDAFVNLFNASRGPGNLTVGPAQRGQEVPKQLWYEYWPEELLEDAPEHSVPVMVLLHGNQNDPRTQAETSGFIQVAAEDRFFVVEMEWQGTPNYAAMGHDGIVIETGQLYKGDVPMIKLVAVMDYGHWNFQPTARIMWDFFSHYRRDPETKKLVYLP